jgi:hypothetical protein
MIRYSKFLQLAAFGSVLCGETWAADSTFQLSVRESEKLGKRSVNGNTASWQNLVTYRISVKNLSLSKEATNLTARYDIFVVRDNGLNDLRKAAAAPERITAVITIPLIKGGETVSVETEPVTLKCSILTNGGYYFNHSRVSRADKLRGVWIKLFSGEQMVGEFLSLPSLKKFGTF